MNTLLSDLDLPASFSVISSIKWGCVLGYQEAMRVNCGTQASQEVQVLMYLGTEKAKVAESLEWVSGNEKTNSFLTLRFLLRPALHPSPVPSPWLSEVWSLEVGVRNSRWTQCKEAQTNAMGCLEQS